jgi:hypothetical protein
LAPHLDLVAGVLDFAEGREGERNAARHVKGDLPSGRLSSIQSAAVLYEGCVIAFVSTSAAPR